MKGSRPVLLLAAALACARPTLPPPQPLLDEYVFPAPGAGEVSAAETRRLERAWLDVLAGRTDAATRELYRLLARRPGLIPAETGVAYARLREGRVLEAAADFAAVLDRRPAYLPALVGAASAAARRGELGAAVGLYRRAQAADPGHPLVRRRLAEAKLRLTDQQVTLGRAAAAAGDLEGATHAYRVALEAAPEVAGVRLEVAELLLEMGDANGAAAVLEADPVGERPLALRLGEVLIGMQSYERALDVYRRLLAFDPADAEAQRRAQEARDALELLRMPDEYRRIPSAPRLTRADLAALLWSKLSALGRLEARGMRVAVDISGSWARESIASVLALDILDVYPNHTFQPAATVRRGDLARALARVLELLGWPSAPAPAPADMARTHLYYDHVVRVLGAGLMDLMPGGAFEPWRPVSGRDAVESVEELARLVGP